MSSDYLTLRGEFDGHNGWVTAICAPSDANAPKDVVISASRDKSIIIWRSAVADGGIAGIPVKRLVGHGHYVQDVAVTADGSHILSGSWDGTLRLWDVKKGKSTRFVGHTKDVLSVAFSEDNRQIVSGSRDRTVRLWNTIGKCKHVFGEQGGHSEWVSCVRFSPIYPNQPTLLVSAGWDKLVKVWRLDTLKLRSNMIGHNGYVTSVAVSPDGSLCASGGKDGKAMLWDLNESKHLSALEAGDAINALVFSPTNYWLCAATASSIVVWNLETRDKLAEVKLKVAAADEPAPVAAAGAAPTKVKISKALPIQVTSLCWNSDGSILYAGYTDNKIRVYQVTRRDAPHA